MAKYQGHKNRNFWNVALYINNDYGLYHLALDAVKNTTNRQHAAEWIMDALEESGITHTPDGVKYSVSAIKAALVEIDS